MPKFKQVCIDKPGKGPCKVPKGSEVDRLKTKDSLKISPIKPKIDKIDAATKRLGTTKNWERVRYLVRGNTYIEDRMAREKKDKKKSDLATIGSNRSLGR